MYGPEDRIIPVEGLVISPDTVVSRLRNKLNMAGREAFLNTLASNTPGRPDKNILTGHLLHKGSTGGNPFEIVSSPKRGVIDYNEYPGDERFIIVRLSDGKIFSVLERAPFEELGETIKKRIGPIVRSNGLITLGYENLSDSPEITVEKPTEEKVYVLGKFTLRPEHDIFDYERGESRVPPLSFDQFAAMLGESLTRLPEAA